MNITEHQQSDVNEFILQVLSKHPDLLSNMQTLMSSTTNKGIFSIQENDQLLIVASAIQSTWHPFCTYIQFAYDFSRPNIPFTNMLIHLQEHFDRPLLFKMDARFGRLRNTLESHAYRLIRQTNLCTIDVAKYSLEPVRLPETVQSLQAIKRVSCLYNQFISLCKHVYTTTHQDNPVAEIPITVWEKIILADILESCSKVLVIEGEVRAFSLMYEGDEPGTWELGWNGAAQDEDLPMLESMLLYQIQLGKKQGIHTIEKENDSTDPFSQYVLKRLPHTVCNTLYTYIE